MKAIYNVIQVALVMAFCVVMTILFIAITLALIPFVFIFAMKEDDELFFEQHYNKD